MTGREDYISREDYIARLAAECGISGGMAEAEVDRALASKRVRRRGWLSDATRMSYVEDGKPDPGPGPVAMALEPMRPIWMERNAFSRVEYCVEDLKYETQHLKRSTKKRTSKPDDQTVNEALRDFAMREGCRLKQADDRANAILDGLGATSRQKHVAFRALPARYRFGRGKPTHDLATR